MRLLALITWPYARKRKLRVALTVASLTMGVALLAAMRLGSQTVLAGFQNAVDRVAGATQLQVTAGDNGFPEEALERVQDLAEVRVASPVIEALAETGQGSILIVAVDMTGDQKLRRYDFDDTGGAVEDPLVFMAHANSILVSRRMADRAGLRVGSELPLQTALGPKRFVVRGILRSGGLADAFGGSLAVMDLYAAQKVFGRGRMLDRIDIGVAEDVKVEDCRRLIQQALGPGYTVEEPAGMRRGMEALTRSLAVSIEITELFALLVAVFIIYNTFSIAAAERRREIGILRALGASRAAVVRLFLLEAGIAGTVGALAGIPLGGVLAGGVAQFLDFLVRAVYGFRLASETPQLSIEWALIGIGAGIAAAVAGAAVPAWTAANDYVAGALRGERAATAGGVLARNSTGALCGIAAAAGAASGAYAESYGLAVIAALLLAPAATVALIRAAAPLLKAIRPVEGALAADSLLRQARRTSATVSALMLALAMAVGVAGVALSSRHSVREWLGNGMTFDLYVTTEPTMTERSLRFPAAFRAELESVEGVEEAQPIRLGRVPFRGAQVMLLSTGIERLARRVRFKLVEGELQSMLASAAAGRGAIISESLSLIRNIHLGDTIEVGPVRLPVVGVHVDYSDQQGVVLIDRAVYVQHWKDESADTFRVYLKPGARPDTARQAILDRFSGRGRLFVMTTAEVKGYVLKIADQWFALTYLQLAIALLVAVLGIVNSLTVSVLDRRRELGVIQAVGGLPWQVRRAIWMESGAIGAIGVVLGVALGAVMLWFNICVMRLDSFGYRFDYIFPAGFAALLLPIVLAAAFLASLGPAESAVRGSLVEALEYE
jgi:putative ABC transport system permease protein